MRADNRLLDAMTITALTAIVVMGTWATAGVIAGMRAQAAPVEPFQLRPIYDNHRIALIDVALDCIQTHRGKPSQAFSHGNKIVVGCIYPSGQGGFKAVYTVRVNRNGFGIVVEKEVP